MRNTTKTRVRKAGVVRDLSTSPQEHKSRHCRYTIVLRYEVKCAPVSMPHALETQNGCKVDIKLYDF